MSWFDILKRLMNASDNVNEVMWYAAGGGHIEIVKLCKEWGQRLLTELWLPLRKMVTSKLWNFVRSGERQILIKLWFTLRYLATSKL